MLLLSGVNFLFAQGGVSSPLGIYGLENTTVAGTRSRAMGWSSIANTNDASALFGNPAMLTRLEQYDIRIGGVSSASTYSQRQEWYPNKVYATLSLLLEDRLIGISDTGQNQIALERKYDDIGPNWESKKSRIRPSYLAAAAPLTVSGMKMTIGVGYAEMIKLDHYFQNNNAMDPYIGTFRPEPYPRPVLGDTIRVRWYQNIRNREGSVYGITPGLSVELFEKISLGVSLTILDGSTDDSETRRARGLFRFATSSTGNFNVYFVDSIYYRQSLKGTSTYSGIRSTFGIGYDGGDYALGVVVKPGYMITRKFSGTLTTDSTGSPTTTQFSGTDWVKIPLTFAFGGSFLLSNRIRFAADYLVNDYSKTEYEQQNGFLTNPWLSGEMFRLGMEFTMMEELSVQCGYRENTQVFSGEGAPIIEDPVHGYGITAGIGLTFGMISLSTAYEYTELNFEDKWISNINYNKRIDHTIVAEAGIRF